MNIIVDGVPIEPNETAITLRRVITSEIDRIGCNIREFELEGTHRSSEQLYQRYEDINDSGISDVDEPVQTPPPAVIVRFVTWAARNKLYEMGNKSQYTFRPDITERRREILEFARTEVQCLTSSSESSPLIDCVDVDRNCRLFMRISATGQVLNFSSEMEFNGHIKFLLESVAPKHEVDSITTNGTSHMENGHGREDTSGLHKSQKSHSRRNSNIKV